MFQIRVVPKTLCDASIVYDVLLTDDLGARATFSAVTEADAHAMAIALRSAIQIHTVDLATVA